MLRHQGLAGRNCQLTILSDSSTAHSPLKRYGAGTESVKNVGVIGLGGEYMEPAVESKC